MQKMANKNRLLLNIVYEYILNTNFKFSHIKEYRPKQAREEIAVKYIFSL